MSEAPTGSDAQRVLVLMPTALDGQRTVALLREASIEAVACSDVSDVCRRVREGADAVLLTENAILGDSAGQLAEAMRAQPAWSSIPVVVIAREGSTHQVQQAASDALRSLIVIERPVRTRSLASVVVSALRSRRHQYQIRDAIMLRERQAAELILHQEALQASEQALAQQAEQLRTADRRKDDFLATLAHELRNPLAPIRTGVDVLGANPDPETAQRALGVMRRQLAHMVRLIDDLLDVSRITRGKMELRRERTTLGAVIDTAIEASRPLIEAGGHQLEVTIHDRQLELHVDPTRLAQVIGNLLNNASRYTPSPGHISLSSQNDGDGVLLSVRDDGVGLTAEQLGTVFEMFSQVGSATGKTQGGLGIGLALVRSLVEMHGGTVSATSPGLGKGCTFSVRLPRLARARAAPAASTAAAPSTVPEGRSVLIVDDNIDAAEMLSMILAGAGWSTRVAHDGQAALQEVSESLPEVVILDIGLPGKDGYEVARELRRTHGDDSLHLVALTGWGTSDDKQRAKEAGFDVHLTKPVDTDKLVATLASLDRRSTAASPG